MQMILRNLDGSLSFIGKKLSYTRNAKQRILYLSDKYFSDIFENNMVNLQLIRDENGNATIILTEFME
jgi:hypothetical protein